MNPPLLAPLHPIFGQASVNRPAACGPTIMSEIGLSALVEWERRWPHNLAAAGREVIAYVPPRGSIRELEALVSTPTTDMAAARCELGH